VYRRFRAYSEKIDEYLKAEGALGKRDPIIRRWSKSEELTSPRGGLASGVRDKEEEQGGEIGRGPVNT